ncbi:glutathione S-transferase [Polycladidibacter hongkongensis]|uniref:glutathione S-transferase n=1 Tax=Polycladidibacter hongkongensis TaxID=1647556 RepID=UPI00083081C5|nr:glutathione S-transferase [Pseudovibrio hongkongensis]
MIRLPLLYSFRRCPYAMRARLAICASQTRVELREIVLRDKPAHMLEISPKGTVPVLQLPDQSVIDESLDIMLWALRGNDPQNWLSPQAGSLDDMLALIAHMDGPFKHHLDRFKYASRFEGANPDEHYASAISALRELANRLEKTPYLFGRTPSLADQALFPFVRQFCNAAPERFASEAPKPVQTWLSERVATPLFASVFGTKWPKWQPGDEPTFFPQLPCD